MSAEGSAIDDEEALLAEWAVEEADVAVDVEAEFGFSTEPPPALGVELAAPSEGETRLKREIERLQQQLKAASELAERERARRERDVIETKRKAVEREVALTQEVAQLRKRVDKLAPAAAVQAEALASRAAGETALRLQVGTLRADVLAAEEAADAARKQAEADRAALSFVDGRLSEAERALREETARADNLDVKLALAESMKQYLSVKWEEAEAEAGSLRSRLAALYSQHEDTLAQLRTARRVISFVRQRMTVLPTDRGMALMVKLEISRLLEKKLDGSADSEDAVAVEEESKTR